MAAPPVVGTEPRPTGPTAVTRSRSIRTTWTAVIVAFLVALIGTGTSTLALIRFQGREFAATSDQFEAELGALSNVQREILEAEVPIGGVLYELDRSGELDQQWTQWEGHVVAVADYFAVLEGLVDGPHAAALQSAQAQWAEVIAGVTAAKAMWGTGEIAAALAAGQDPFGPTVWASLTKTEHSLASLAVDSVERLRQEADVASDRQSLATALFVAVLTLFVGLGVLLGRRVSRSMIRPLLDLRASVTRLRDGELACEMIVPSQAGTEVVELASAMADMAATIWRSQRRLQHEADTDGLTGLANRRAFSALLDGLVSDGVDGRTAVLLIDIDDFKHVNDSLGHAAGDELLIAIAGRLGSAARDQDTVARFGGDEFAVLVHGDDALAAATQVADRILASLSKDLQIDGQVLKVSCSIGVADGHGLGDAEDLLRRADGAMYVAKSRGKNCFELYDPVLHATMRARSDLKVDLRGAVDAGQLVAHYQPVVDLQTDEVVGFEALVRWNHPTRGLLLPGDFLSQAEESGDIVAIGEWMIDRACRDLVAFQAGSALGDRLWMAVNMSPRQILGGSLVPTVRRAMARHGVRPEALIMEITEGSLLTDPVQATVVLNELRAQGVRIAIDDFGTGFSSLQYLSTLPVDVLKIDRSFVASSGDSGEGDVILQTIVSLGRGLGLTIVAEGIEQPDELARLRSLGAMAGQGI